MKKSKFSEEQIAYALRWAEAGTPIADVDRQVCVSKATFYGRREQFANRAWRSCAACTRSQRRLGA